MLPLKDFVFVPLKVILNLNINRLSDTHVHVAKLAWGLAFQRQQLHVSCIKLCQQKATSGRPLCLPLQEILWLKSAVDC